MDIMYIRILGWAKCMVNNVMKGTMHGEFKKEIQPLLDRVRAPPQHRDPDQHMQTVR